MESMPSPILDYFQFAHLPEPLRSVSQPLCELACDMERKLPDGPEKEMGLRKLLEAKDCMVRAVIPKAAVAVAAGQDGAVRQS